MTPKIKLVTIGVYGFDEGGFFRTLKEAGVDTLVDIRQRRGMRGAKYAFANSARLQARLEALGIRYLHCKALAPTTDIRQIQVRADDEQGILKSERTGLSPAYIRAYQEKILDSFDAGSFFGELPPDSRTVALFCVEGKPSACHRSLVAEYLSKHNGFIVEDILPWKS